MNCDNCGATSDEQTKPILPIVIATIKHPFVFKKQQQQTKSHFLQQPNHRIIMDTIQKS